jgi:hypothetical protein
VRVVDELADIAAKGTVDRSGVVPVGTDGIYWSNPDPLGSDPLGSGRSVAGSTAYRDGVPLAETQTLAGFLQSRGLAHPAPET